MPYMSKVSRSNQSAPGNTSMIDGTGVVLVGLDLHPDALVLGERQQMVDHVEAPLALRPVDRGDVDEAS